MLENSSLAAKFEISYLKSQCFTAANSSSKPTNSLICFKNQRSIFVSSKLFSMMKLAVECREVPEGNEPSKKAYYCASRGTKSKTPR